MKNFILQKTVHGKSSWLLLSLRVGEGNPAQYKPFSEFVYWMERRKGYTPNTVDQYAGHVARFLDFIYEASDVTSDPDIAHLIDMYEDYLIMGPNSDKPEVVELSERLDKSKTTSHQSISQGIESSIKLFLEYQITRSELLVDDILRSYYKNVITRSDRENRAIRDDSWLASTIRGSLKRSLSNGKYGLFAAAKGKVKTTAANKSFSLNKTRAFPLDKAVDFLSQRVTGRRATFLRNMCFFSLLAASGGRSSEILQLRTVDIDAKNRLIYLRTPFAEGIKGLTPQEVRALSWKGRSTEETFLIEPFASIFWSYLSHYISEVFQSNVNHDYVFQKADGRPMFTWDISNRRKVMRQYARVIGLDTATSLSPHSFRHMYGFYTLNYLPLNNGETLGLPMAYVKILMGHQSIKSTERYALHDTDLLAKYIEIANKFTKENTVNALDLEGRLIAKNVFGQKP